MAIYKNVEPLELVSWTATGHDDYDDGFTDGVGFMLDKLDALPEENIAPREAGRWLLPSRCGYNISWDAIGFVCSECKKMNNSKSAYCPECGARMIRDE